ncbi:hypothetical protein [Enterococcus avium]|uniref:hypothetical protein n=1 Tax=Enterococcus avium TaxID=33945 RepID=UPI00268A2DEF|nr:hypothetical protein [Enterococcus avium]
MKVIVLGSSHGGYEAVEELLLTHPKAEVHGTKKVTLSHLWAEARKCISKDRERRKFNSLHDSRRDGTTRGSRFYQY